MGSQFQSTVLLWWRTVNDAYRQRLSSDQFPWRRGGSALGLGVCYILVEMPSSLSDRVPAYEEEEEEDSAGYTFFILLQNSKLHFYSNNPLIIL